MKGFDPSRLRSASTARTYPVKGRVLASAIEEAVLSLPRWTLADTPEGEIRAVRKRRLIGLQDGVAVILTPSPVGAHTNTRATFRSASRIGGWDLVRNNKNLNTLLAAIDQKLTNESR